MNQFNFDLFILKQRAVIRLHQMECDSNLKSISGTIKSESGRVFDVQINPVWLDDDSRVLNIMGL